ncbi:pre-peptidase C-terminal domain-containing protein [Pseudoalteromonas denitrificans]|uniref:Pre-peptidase C-terminal domain-containing protein n=1 Tax=Pseudoalteromonas denitrificans DSM 6059 TaxID=1123010 RepID=A0A1I1SL64_9GAMM|nr:pre-peptidase C-terminal domain-containing protein [Pseudoalteromonas denitrificans]SFD47209.1 pre-peptidase C-terminal domain-containing protein [Pseudoalteromonas denitrificans DSM 6059]
MIKCLPSLLALSIGMTTSVYANKTQNPNPIIIADTISHTLSLKPTESLQQDADNINEIKITKAGSSFIKVHFDYFNLPAGAYITVSSKDGQESYQYNGIDHSNATFNNESGENGQTQFSAMSVFGDTAIIKLVIPAGIVWESKHGINIDSYNAGHPDNEVFNNNTEDLTPESTCGINERKDVACWESSHPVEFDRTRPVARLLMAGSGLCTGWRVGNDNRMFTNNHCLSTQGKLEDTEVWFNYQRTSCGGSSNATTIKVTGKDLLKTNYDLDYSLFTVNNFNTIDGFGNFGLDVRTPTLGEFIYIAQHGAGNPKELSIESDKNASGRCEIDLASVAGRAADTDTGYFCDTTGGSSGSPVLAASSNKVIALHHFGGCENQGVKIEKIWPEVSSFFNETPPPGDTGPGNKAPVAQFTASCDNLSCTFDGTASSDSDGTIVSYDWNLSDGTVLTGANVQHAFAASQTYSVTLTVKDDKDALGKLSQDISVSDNPSNNELQSGVPINNLLAAKDAELDYFINTTENDSQVTITTSGGRGDVDLYVRKGEMPTKQAYDCRPFISGNNETCRVLLGTPGKVHVKLIGYSDFSEVSLVANITASTGSGFPKTGLSVAKGNWDHYSYTVPQGVTKLEITSSGGTGDADLYVQKGAAPTKTVYDCRPFKSGNTETCSITVSQGEEIYIGLYAYSNFSDLTLDVK